MRRTGFTLLAAVLLLHGGLVPIARAGAPATPVARGPLAVDGDPISAVVPTLPGATALYVLGGNGLYRSEDGGRTWHLAGPVPPAAPVAASVDNPSLLLAGDHPVCALSYEGGTPLSRSDDGGATWQTVDGVIGIRPVTIWDDAKVALGVGCRGVHVSSDGGQTWGVALPLPVDVLNVTAVAAIATSESATPAALVVGTSEGGNSVLWQLDLSVPTQPRFGEPLVPFWGLGAVAGRDERHVVGSAVGVWVSDNPAPDGEPNAPWHVAGLVDVTVSVADPAREGIPAAERQRGYGIDAVAIDQGDPDHLYAGTVGGLYLSRDAGTTWEPVEGADGRVTSLVLARDPEGSEPTAGRLLAQTEDGVVEVTLRT